jgi:hypothetical protein
MEVRPEPYARLNAISGKRREARLFGITSAAGFDKVNYRAATLSMVAGVVHGIAMAQYMPQWWGYGIFFVGAALAQIIYGVVLLIKPWQYDETGGIRESDTSGARVIYIVGLLMTVAFIVFYLITRTLGIPFMGPMAGDVEPFDPLGILAQVIHAVLALHLWALVRYTAATATDPKTASNEPGTQIVKPAEPEAQNQE